MSSLYETFEDYVFWFMELRTRVRIADNFKKWNYASGSIFFVIGERPVFLSCCLLILDFKEKIKNRLTGNVPAQHANRFA